MGLFCEVCQADQQQHTNLTIALASCNVTAWLFSAALKGRNVAFPCCPAQIWQGLTVSRPSAGDVNSIKVGDNSNIQDNVVVHVAKHNAQNRALPTIIGNNVTIGECKHKPLAWLLVPVLRRTVWVKVYLALTVLIHM